MPESQVEIRSMMKEPSAHIPLVMSLTGLALIALKVVGDFATHGGLVHEADEGIEAHLWQLLMVGQVPVMAFFAFKWLRRAPSRTLCVLASQTGAALTSIAAVFLFRL
jgi:hypothetical protein